MQFANPYAFWLFLLYIPLIIWYIFTQSNSYPSIGVSSTKAFASMPTSWRQYLRHFLFIMRLGAICCVIVVLARPQMKDQWSTSSTEGTDIVLALDISSSMYARDFKPDRFEAARNVASWFVQARENDNLGLVLFAGESLTGMPMTVDRNRLLSYLEGVQIGMLEDGTAIGDGIATALNRLKEGKAKSKSIVLITDGSNNTGIVAPISAAEVAKEMGVKIYTIGIGTNGMAPYPVRNLLGQIEFQNQKVEIDEATLRSIADLTGGKYFRATDNNALQEVFNEIDTLEKTRMDVKMFSHTEDNYILWAWLAFGIFCLELILRYLFLRPIP